MKRATSARVTAVAVAVAAAVPLTASAPAQAVGPAPAAVSTATAAAAPGLDRHRAGAGHRPADREAELGGGRRRRPGAPGGRPDTGGRVHAARRTGRLARLPRHPARTMGLRVRVGSFATRAEAATAAGSLTDAGLHPRVEWNGYDADQPADGEHVHVAVIGPRHFRGRVVGTHRGDVTHRETTSSVARGLGSLGAVQAPNLDGGGSTAMTVRGRLVNDPSDGTGERAVGDTVQVLPADG